MASVGAMLEPLGMLFHPRMIGRALDGEIERDLDAQRVGRRDEVVEVVERAERGLDGGVPAVRAADRPGAAGIARLGDERVVLSLAVGRSDGMHRGRGRGRRSRSLRACGSLRSASRSVAALPGSVPCERGNIWYQALTRAFLRCATTDNKGSCVAASSRSSSRSITLGEIGLAQHRERVALRGRPVASLRLCGRAEPIEKTAKSFLLALRRGAKLDSMSAIPSRRSRRHVAPGLDFLAESLRTKEAIAVGPGFDREEVVRVVGQEELAAQAVVVDGAMGHFVEAERPLPLRI